MATGERIKAARKAANNGKGMTQKELGQITKINEANIRKYESGRQNPKIETLQKIADALGVPVWDLLDDYRFFSDENPMTKEAEEKARIYRETYTKEERERIDRECAELEIINQVVLAIRSMNEQGQQKAAEQVTDLAKIPEYQKKDSE